MNKLKDIGNFVYMSLNKPGRRVISLLLACAMFLAQIPVVTADSTDSNATEISVASYSTDAVYIYSWMNYLTADTNNPLGTSGGSYRLTGTKANFNIHIGDHISQEPLSHDIPVALHNLNMSNGSVYINTVNDGSHTVEMTVTGESTITNLTILENATLTLYVNANFNVTNLHMGERSHLTLLVTDGVSCNITNLTGNTEITQVHLDAGSEAARTDIQPEFSSVTVPVTGTTADTLIPGDASTNTQPSGGTSTDAQPSGGASTDTQPSGNQSSESLPVTDPGMASIPGVVSVGQLVMGSILPLLKSGNDQDSTPDTPSVPAEVYGDVTVNAGNGTLNLDTVAINSLTADGAVINVNSSVFCAGTITIKGNAKLIGTASATVTAGGNISVTNSQIQTFALFGYDADANGEKTMAFSGAAQITNVEVLGAAVNTQAIVTITGLSGIAEMRNSAAISDFPVTFKHGDAMQSLDMTHYRAQYSNKDGTSPTVLGKRTSDGYIANTMLPEFTLPGYAFNGWQVGDSDILIPVDNLNLDGNVSQAGALTLITQTTGNGVAINWDLGSLNDQKFVPDQYNTEGKWLDWVDGRYTTSAIVDETVDPGETPFWLGHSFQGWQTQRGNTHKDPFVVSSDEWSEDAAGKLYMNMTAQWETETYKFRLSTKLGGLSSEYMAISFDGGTTWTKLTDVHNGSASLPTGITYHKDSTDEYISFSEDIRYGESMEAFFLRIGVQFPLLMDTRESAVVQDFAGWKTERVNTVTAESTFSYGAHSNDMLDNRSTAHSLTQYSQDLKKTPFLLVPSWGTMAFDLTVDADAGTQWTYLVNGTAQDPDASGRISVPRGAQVTFRTSYTNANLASRWVLKANGQRIYLQEQPYTAGISYLDYTFTMPAAAVDAQYVATNSDYYFDLAQAPITFAENVVYNGLVRKGFWYNHEDSIYSPLFAKLDSGTYKELSQLTSADVVTDYFYTWESNNFYVTSRTVTTQNQLTLVNAITVYLKDCNLVATDDYMNEAYGTKLGEKELNKTSANGYIHPDTGKYGNIVVDNSAHNSYIVTLHIDGKNTVNAIVQASVNSNDSYTTTLNIKGNGASSSELNLGTNYGNFLTRVNDVCITGIEDNFNYIFYAPNEKLQKSEFKLTNAELNAPTKCVYITLGNMYAAGNSQIDLGSTYIGYWFHMTDTSYARIRGDYGGEYFGFDMIGSSSAVVDGNMVTSGTWYQDNQKINTTGYLIVKGYMRAGHITLKKGTLIANTIEMDYRADISGGTIITNQLIHCPVADSLPQTNYTEKRKDTALQYDQIPFPTYVARTDVQTRLFEFNGTAKVYLFGYYKTTPAGNFDFLGDWITADSNPMRKWISGVIDPETGDLKSTSEIADFLNDEALRDDILTTANQYKAETMKQECVALGNSNEDIGTGAETLTSITIGGNAAIYAAGNLTFFNETIITDNATVVCYGNLRSNRDLIIKQHAQVTADAIGNSAPLAHKDSDGTSRWQQLIVQGGTITTGQLGFDDDTRTTIVVEGNPVFNAATAGKEIAVVRDTRINYVYSKTEFNGPEQNYDNVRVNGIWSAGLVHPSTTEKNFATITSVDQAEANWALGSLAGEQVSKMNTEGKLDNPTSSAVYALTKISLYAVKETYGLAIEAGTNYLTSLTINEELHTPKEYIQVTSSAQVTLQMTADNKDMAEKTVVWYQDANGIVHNVQPHCDITNGTVSFVMPSSSVEVFITDEILLDLHQYPITFTATGFAVDASVDGTTNTIRDDALFDYKGNLKVTQSSIEKIEYASAYIGSHSAGDAQLSVTPKTGYDTTATANGITVIGDPAFKRTITLEKIYQDRIKGTYGLYAFNGADIDILFSGANRIDAIGAKTADSKVILSGKQGYLFTKDSKKTGISGKDGLYLTSYNKQYDSNAITAANIQISNMVLLKNYNGEMFGFAGDCVVDLKNLYISMSAYNGPVFTKKLSALTVTDCAVYCTTAQGNSGLIFKNVGDATFKNCYVSFTYGGTVLGSAPMGHATTLTLIDTAWNVLRRTSVGDTPYLEFLPSNTTAPASVILKGTSSIVLDYRLQLLKVTLYDASSITVKKPSGYRYDSVFLCKDITLEENAHISADYVIISGFIENAAGDRSTYSTFLEWAQNETYLIKTGRLNMCGGQITADKAVGGAYGATIEVSGGTLNAPIVGTLTNVYGYTAVIPKATEQFVYSYALAPSQCSSTVTISGGTVNVGNNGYLGGHNSTVTISGGRVNLGDNATLGLTDAQLDAARKDATSQQKDPAQIIKIDLTISGGTVEGNIGSIISEDVYTTDEKESVIQAPYGTIHISGTSTAVKVGFIRAEEGTIDIQNASGTYDLPAADAYVAFPAKAGVYVGDSMTALQIDLSEGTMVYAGKALADIPAGKTGYIKITHVAPSDTRLYVNSYGASGEGATTDSLKTLINSGGEEKGQNVIKQAQIVRITYYLNGSPADPASNHPSNVPSYISSNSGEPIQLYTPTRFGFDFEGWYLDKEFSAGSQISSINRSFSDPVDLYAKWKPTEINIRIVIDPDKGPDGPNWEKETAGLEKIAFDETENLHIYTASYTLPYGTAITGEQGINLMDLHLKSYTPDQLSAVFTSEELILNSGATIDRGLLEKYVAYTNASGNEGKPLTLRVSGVRKGSEQITFNLNNSNALAYGAQFTVDKNASDPDKIHSSYVEFGELYVTDKGLQDKDGNFIEAVAVGYYFRGWSTIKGGKDPVDFSSDSTILDADNPQTEFYAIWEPKTYQIQFETPLGKIEPPANETGVSGENVWTTTMKYDEVFHALPIVTQPGWIFEGWFYGDEEILLGKDTSNKSLNTRNFPNRDQFDPEKPLADTSAIVLLAEEPDEGAEDPIAMTLKAKLRGVEVTYDLNGGHWTDSSIKSNSEEPAYGAPLRGYSRNIPDPGTASNTYTVDAPVSADENDVYTYGIVSTTPEYFTKTTNLQYWHDDTGTVKDYRLTLRRNGYTFEGWFDAEGNEVFTTPADDDITVCAKWTPNTYFIDLHAYDVEAYKAGEYNNSSFSNDYLDANGEPLPGKYTPKATLTVDSQITENSETDTVVTIYWPHRDTNGWYAYSPVDVGSNGEVSESDRRYLLGFTFAPLDPGCRKTNDNTYLMYAAAVTDLMNEGLLMQEGKSTFLLPELFGYTNVADITEVMDYPNGSTMPMYAVYRERSLVFMEAYSKDTVVYKRELAAFPYQDWVNYPWDTSDAGYKPNQKLIADGYTQLSDWYFLAPTPDSGRVYPTSSVGYSASYWADRAQNTTIPGSEKSYDIHVYTIYVAQDDFTADLHATVAYDKEDFDDYFDEYTIPGSMQSDAMTYQILDTGGLTLVTKDTITSDSGRYDTAYSMKTAAIRWNLVDNNGIVRAEGDLLNTDAPTDMGSVAVSAGWKIRLDLYTSKILSDDASYHLKVKFGFQGAALVDQYITLTDLLVDLNPTVYNVRYDANLPKDSALHVIDYVHYADDGKEDGFLNTKVGYGTSLTKFVPRLTGYIIKGQTDYDEQTREVTGGTWYQTNADGTPIAGVSRTFGAPLDLYDPNGQLYFKTEWQAKEYQLTISSDVMQLWNVQVEKLNIDTGVYETLKTFTGTTKVNQSIPYHAKITFTPKATDIDPSEYYYVNIDQSVGNSHTVSTLDGLKANNYTLLAEDRNINITRQTVRTLYLEKGTIHITESGYTQVGQTTQPVIWPGSYNILMDETNNTDGSETPNVLTLAGDLETRAINLGNLKITSDNSIELKDNTKANLTLSFNGASSTVDAKNILVPTAASLTMATLHSTAVKGALNLTPAIRTVALGGSGTQIKLENVAVDLTLPAADSSGESNASGVSATSVIFTDSTVNVTQHNSAQGSYHGTWIGGENTTSVVLDNTDVLQKEDAAGLSYAYAIRATGDVALKNHSTVGSKTSNIGDVGTRIYAGHDLIVEDSEIYQTADIDGLPLAAGSNILVNGISDIHVVNTGSWPDGEIYGGTMKINNVNSQVIIRNTMILEMSHGAVQIEENTVKQSGVTKNFSHDYLLLQELSLTANDLTVNRSDVDITVKHPKVGQAFFLDDIVLKKDADISLTLTEDTNLTVKKVDIQKDTITLTVDATADGTVTLAKDALASAKGIYIQNGGRFKSVDAIQSDALNMSLTRVLVDAKDLIAKNLTLTDSTVTCTGGQVGSKGVSSVTTVTLAGNTQVTAGTVGALGDWNTTFTFVKVEGDQVKVNGNLTQDHYRIVYEGANPASLYSVFRTEQKSADGVNGTQTAELGGIPGKPDPIGNFGVWYYKDGDDLYALSTADATVPGYKANSVLTADLVSLAGEPASDDGTRTLTLYAGMNLTLTAAIAEDRLFTTFNSSAREITIPANSAWTAYLQVEGTIIPGSKYQLHFDQELPADTKLTLISLDTMGNATGYYYYIVPAGGTDFVTLSAFTVMGGTEKAQVPSPARYGNPGTEKMLLAADFSGANAPATGPVNITFKYVTAAGADICTFRDALQYTLTAIDGNVSADFVESQLSVTVTPPVNSAHAGKNLALVATITGADISPKAQITLEGGIVGKPIGNNQYVFPIGTLSTQKPYVCNMFGFYGDDMSITWSLMLQQDGANVLGDQIAVAPAVSFSKSAPVDPYLKVELTEGQAHTLPVGQQPTTVVMKYKTNASSITAILGKQNGTFATFPDTGATVTISAPDSDGEGTITVSIPGTKGVYRVCVSMDNAKTGSLNDNVYHTFVVVDKQSQ